MRNARQPMFIAWEPERTFLYNDAYATLLASKHPAALGAHFADVWSEIRSDIDPPTKRVFASKSVHMDDITLFVERNGEKAKAHFAFSYTPIYDESGDIAGLFCPTNGPTGRIMTERAAAGALAAAEEASIVKSQILANMSHELPRLRLRSSAMPICCWRKWRTEPRPTTSPSTSGRSRETPTTCSG